ncbi:MAG: DUF4878 domain-containing protein [Chloroflexi bacterium]|nr:MAG: DUF4878 domain-containing protein [Chloroflexota bacterium]
MSPLGNLDRSSWLVLASAAVLAVVGMGTTFVVRNTWPAADTVTPTGVVATYVRAVQAGDAARAWLYLTHDATQAPAGEPPRPVLSQADFRNQVESSRQPTSPRVRILSVTQSGDTASVTVEVSRASGEPLTGATTQQFALSLVRVGSGWQIASDPFPWQFQ